MVWNMKKINKNFSPIICDKFCIQAHPTLICDTRSQESSLPTCVQLPGRQSRSLLPSPARIRVCTSSCARRTPGSATKCSPRMWVSEGTGRATPSHTGLPPRHSRPWVHKKQRMIFFFPSFFYHWFFSPPGYKLKTVIFFAPAYVA